MKINWNFLGGGGVQKNKKPSMGGAWIFSGTAHCQILFVDQWEHLQLTSLCSTQTQVKLEFFTPETLGRQRTCI